MVILQCTCAFEPRSNQRKTNGWLGTDAADLHPSLSAYNLQRNERVYFIAVMARLQCCNIVACLRGRAGGHCCGAHLEHQVSWAFTPSTIPCMAYDVGII